jgi:hypothetical protein
MSPRLLLAVALLVPVAARSQEAPAVEHQPAICTVPEKPLSLCASISDDGNVAVSRIYFRSAGQDFFAFVDMSFTGVGYCGTLPGPRPKTRAIEYYVQAVDDSYQPTRTSTYRIPVQPEGVCEFPPLEKDTSRAAAIRVFATNRKQGRKLDDGFVATGVAFVPAAK